MPKTTNKYEASMFFQLENTAKTNNKQHFNHPKLLFNKSGLIYKKSSGPGYFPDDLRPHLQHKISLLHSNFQCRKDSIKCLFRLSLLLQKGVLTCAPGDCVKSCRTQKITSQPIADRNVPAIVILLYEMSKYTHLEKIKGKTHEQLIKKGGTTQSFLL